MHNFSDDINTDSPEDSKPGQERRDAPEAGQGEGHTDAVALTATPEAATPSDTDQVEDRPEDPEAIEASAEQGAGNPSAGQNVFPAARPEVPSGSGGTANEAGEKVDEPDDSGEEADAPAPVSDAEIPWRGMPSLPASEAPAVGILNGMQGAGSECDVLCDCPCRGQGQEADEDTAESELVLGVKLSQYGPVYFFRAGQEKVRSGRQVLVETEQGLALGEVVTARRLRLPLPKIRTEEGGEVEIKPIRGLAGPEDIAASSDNRILAASARLFCKECIRERALDMKLVDVEVLHDRSKIIFYFTAPSRIDFRELVKDLVRNYHTRIELRQIGVRHETQMIGAVGNCGMTCCCRRYLCKFAPVTIKMAKEQNLFLNPAKLSGICGRLLCCLAYEQEHYEEFHKRSPKIGKKYKTSQGFMRVLRANLFRQSIFVMDENNSEMEMQLDEWEALLPVRHDQGHEPSSPGGAAGPGGQAGQADGGAPGGHPGRRERRPDQRRDGRDDTRNGGERRGYGGSGGPGGRDRSDRDERFREDRPERPERTEHSERPDRADRGDRYDRRDHERGRRDNRDRPGRSQREDGRPQEPERDRQRHKNDGISIATQRPFQDMTNDIESERPVQLGQSDQAEQINQADQISRAGQIERAGRVDQQGLPYAAERAPAREEAAISPQAGNAVVNPEQAADPDAGVSGISDVPAHDQFAQVAKVAKTAQVQDGPVQASRIFSSAEAGNRSGLAGNTMEGGVLDTNGSRVTNEAADEAGDDSAARDKSVDSGADKSIFGLPGARFAKQGEKQDDKQNQRGNKNKKFRPNRQKR